MKKKYTNLHQIFAMHISIEKLKNNNNNNKE